MGTPDTTRLRAGAGRHRPTRTYTSLVEVSVSRRLKAITIAVFVSAVVAGIAPAGSEAVAAPVQIPTFVAKHARLDWSPARPAPAAARQTQAAAGTSIRTFSTNVQDGASTFQYRMVG